MDGWMKKKYEKMTYIKKLKIDGWLDDRKTIRINSWMVGWKKKWMDQMEKKWMVGWIDKTNKMDGWMDMKKMDGWMDKNKRWMVGWIEKKWMVGCI